MNLLYIDRPLVINPALAERIGLNEAIVLQQMSYWLTKTKSGVLHGDKVWIYNTYSEWKSQIPFMSERTIQRVILKLEDKGIIESFMLNKSKGDRTKYYTINSEHEALTPIVPMWHDHSANVAPSSCQVGTLSTETTTETTHILKPLSSLLDHAAEIIEYLNQQAGTKFKNAKSHARLIDARLKEGHTVDDIKSVIDRKVAEWANTKMAQYLRPSTLFSDTNFNNYVGQLNNQPVGNNYDASRQNQRNTWGDPSDTSWGDDLIGQGLGNNQPPVQPFTGYLPRVEAKLPDKR